MGLPVYHCKHNFLHVYFEQTELKQHESDCSCKPKPTIALDKAEDQWSLSKSADPILDDSRDSFWGDLVKDKATDPLNKTLQAGSGRSWDTTTAEDAQSPEDSKKQNLSEVSKLDQKVGRNEGFIYTMAKIILVWFMAIAACALLYTMVQSLDYEPVTVPQTISHSQECETQEPIFIALNTTIDNWISISIEESSAKGSIEI